MHLFRLIVAAYVAVGCTPDPKQRLETTCADSFKISLKDPDSLSTVANLGVRGITEDAGKGFWLRYKAKNSYGAFESRNVYCAIETDGTAKRDVTIEHIHFLREQISLRRGRNRIREAGKSVDELIGQDVETIARQTVFESVENLLLIDKYVP